MATPSTTQPTKCLRILVVDDIEQSRVALCQQIDALGHISSHCSGGQEALMHIEHATPDLVLLDLWMPDVNGFNVIRRVRQIITERWLPIIVTSALQGENHFIDALTLGADDYLSRPVNLAFLRAKLDHYQRVLAIQNRLFGLANRERLIYQHIPEAVLSFDAQGTVNECNQAAIDLLQALGQTDPVGRSLHSLLGLSVDQVEQVHEALWTLADGRTLPVELSCGRWLNAGVDLRTLLIRDQSEKKRLETMKDEFMATVSHELRTPLTSIVGALGLLESGVMGALPGPAHDMLKVARRNSERLRSLIDDVLDLTKLQGNQLRFQWQTMALADLLRESISTNAGMAQAKGVALTLQDGSQNAWVHVDPHRLLQVMANLMSNAIKHAPQGSSVEVRLRGCALGWRVEVQDRGPGVSALFRKRLFEKFAQEDGSDRRQYGGTGLGLYISKMLVERMQGQIGLMPADSGPGACFYVELPSALESAERPRVLGLSLDAQEALRWRDWLQDQADLLHCLTLEQARQALHQHGPCVVIANPAGQGPADRLCDALLQHVPAHRVLVISDAADAPFADSRDVRWIAQNAQLRQQMQSAVQRMLRPSIQTGSGHA
jgi:signal transduction histidine kinase